MRKILKSLFIFTLSVLIFVQVVPVLSANAATHFQTITGGTVNYTYNVENNLAVITNVTIDSTSSNLQLNIPETLGGYAVNNISSNAFSTGSQKISTLKLPINLKFIGSQAFHALSNMTTVYVPKNISGVAGSCFGPDTKVSTLYLRTSSTSNSLIDSADQIISNLSNLRLTTNYELDKFKTCNTNGSEQRFGIMELIDSLSYSPLMNNICSNYSTQIVNSIIPSGTSDIKKMQIIYNYIITHNRYSKLYSQYNNSTIIELDNLHQKELGTLIFGSGVCASMARTVKLLGKTAGLDVHTIGRPGHVLNIFRPSGSLCYYYIDTCANTFMIGSNSGTETTTDGIVCPISSTHYGSTIQIKINNNSSIPFNINLSEINNMSRKYINYNAINPNEESTLTFTDLPKNKNVSLYAFDNQYYNLTINHNNSNVLNLDYALNRGNNFSSSFTDTNGNLHSYTISIVQDPNDDRTLNHAYFLITIN